MGSVPALCRRGDESHADPRRLLARISGMHSGGDEPPTLHDHDGERFERDGMLVVPDALSPDLLDRLLDAHDRIYREENAAGRLASDGSLHLLGFLERDDVYAELLDLPTTFPAVCGILGWNIFMYHCHLDVHPPLAAPGPRKWRWHQDGGRQNLELEGAGTRPRLSVKVAYFLTDVSEPDRGNLTVIPGSHTRNAIPRPGREVTDWDDPPGAVPVLAKAGSAVIFDRRLWHARSDNRSSAPRKALFLAYTYRWIRPRDEIAPRAWPTLSPVRRQLLGDGATATGYWIPTDDDAPLRRWLGERGLLDPSIPSNR